MATKIRVVLALVICVLLAGLIGLGRWGTGRDVDTAEPAGAALTHGDCRQCHAAVWQEWEESFHSRAVSDPHVQAAFEYFRGRKCRSCHAPRPVLASGVNNEVQLRPQDQESGVNCLSCHGTADGRGVAARRTIADAPCRPVQHAQLATSRMCGTCHDAIYKDWQESRYREQRTACHDCHMPPVADRPHGRSHLYPGSHDPATIRSAAKMSCRREGDALVVSVTNHATGHNYPGERHNRQLRLEVSERDAAGEIVLSRLEIIKTVTPFRGESSADKIRAGETFQARFPVVESAVSADVRLLYQRFSYLEALIVHRAELNLKQP